MDAEKSKKTDIKNWKVKICVENNLDINQSHGMLNLYCNTTVL